MLDFNMISGIFLLSFKYEHYIVKRKRVSRNLVEICVQLCDTEQEKLFVGTPSEIGSEKFNLGIESFRQGIGRAVVVEVQNLIVMFVEGSSNDIERMQSASSTLLYHRAIDSRAVSLMVFLEKIIRSELRRYNNYFVRLCCLHIISVSYYLIMY